MSQARILTDKEYRKVLLHISKKKHSARNKAILYMSHLAGLRCGEIASLSIGDVLTKDGQIKDEVFLRKEQTKGNRGRTFLLPKKLQDELHSYLCNRFNLKDLKAVTYTDTSKALFFTQKNSQSGFSPNSISQLFSKIYTEAGIVGASSHSGRRFFCTKIFQAGFDPKIAQQLLGHRQIQTTYLYYQTSPESLRKAVEVLS
jgi:integrase/recombinase XerD